MIIMEDVTKTYTSGVPALNGINLHVQKGEFVFIVGKSGSGKSTLIKLLLKELDPTSGKIYVNKSTLINLQERSYHILEEISVLYFRISDFYQIVIYTIILHLHRKLSKLLIRRLRAGFLLCFQW